MSVNDLYSFLYDREVNKTEERRSTLINFRQVMLDVEYIRYVVGPSNEIKIWTLAAGTAQHRGGSAFKKMAGLNQAVRMSSNLII